MTFADFAPRMPIYGVRGPRVAASPHPGSCAACSASVELLLESRAGGFCLACAGFGDLVFLPSGDPALSRRAREASRQAAVVVRVNWRRQRYERNGTLVEHRALELAARQCLDDPAAVADRRIRDRRRAARGGTPWEDVADAVRTRFPGCPRPEVIAFHAALRPSALEAIELAVASSVLHVDTDYDERVQAGVDRAEAHARVR